MEDNQIVELVIEKLNQEDLWFTQKTDPTWEEPSKYYKLDEYGDPTETAIKEIAKEVNSLVGDGAVDLEDAIEVWVNNALMEYRVAYTGTLVTKFKDKQVVDQIEAYESQALKENKKLTESADKTKVIFRKDKEDGDIIAVFPEDKQDNGMIGCYAHIGQHSTMSLDYYKKTIPATPEEYKDLKAELENKVGYNLEVVTKLDESKTKKAETKKEMSIHEIVDWIEKTGHIKMYNEYASREENAGKPIPVLLKGFYDWVNSPEAPMVGDLDFINESIDEIPAGAKIARGVCPYCGSKLKNYSDTPEVVEYNDYVSYLWHCDNCGKDGQEIFSMDFIGHDVYRNDEDDSETDFVEKTENKNVNFNKNTKDKKEEDYKRRLKEENNKSANLISDMFKSKDFDADSKQGQIVMRTSELFNALSGKGYDVQVAFDNGESTNSILLGQQGGQVIITINNTDQPLRAFTSGNFEISDENIKILTDIQNEIETL